MNKIKQEIEKRRIFKNCKYCKKEFESFISDNKSFCNEKCYGIYLQKELPKEVIELYNLGWSMKKISEKFNYGNVRNFLLRKGIKLREKNSWQDKPNTPKNIKILKELYYKNLNDKEIASYMEYSQSTISKLRKSLGLKTRNNPIHLSYRQKEDLNLYGVVLNEMNAFRLGNGAGGDKHEKAKFAVWKILIKMNRKVLTEARTFSGIIDVYDFTEKTIYELETDLTEKVKERKFNQLFNEKYMKDFNIFNVSEMPDDLEGMDKWIKDKMGWNL